MDRRIFLQQSGGAALALSVRSAMAAEPEKAPHVLLRSSWQTVNIGDIAHTPGVLRILKTHLPQARVTLWPSNVENGVDKLLLNEFPGLSIAKPGSDALRTAFDECDFLLHGSGASIVAERDLIRWKEETGKPYGIYGITFPRKKSSATNERTEEALARSIEVLSNAAFVYFRDSKSLELAKSLGASSPVMEFGPDGAFACDLRDADQAEAFLNANDLETGKFLCCIPRLRYTPYWTIKKGRAFDPVKHARNEAMKEHDHAPLRDAIEQVVRTTDLKVLVCPEDRTQMTVGKEMIYDKLPDDILDRVVWRPDYWLTGEAISVYVRSAGLFGNEMHSPIMCIGHGIPAIVCRFEEQTSKGFMWEDIGLGEWLFDHDSPSDQQRIVDEVVQLAKQPDQAKEKAARAKAFVERKQAETMQTLRGVVSLFAFIAMALITPNLVAQESTVSVDIPENPDRFHLFVLAGQSNMAGRGAVAPEDREPNLRVLVFDQNQQWAPAVDPLHFDKPKIAGVGLGRTFALDYVEANPGITVGLIPCAVGGSPIDSWTPGGYHASTSTHPLDDCWKRMSTALPGGTLKGILWHQGESDSNPKLAESYENKLHQLIDRFRVEFQAPKLPFVVGQMGQFSEKPWSNAKKKVDQAHQQLPDKVAGTAFVSSDGLQHKGDAVHFNALAYRKLGHRYFQAYDSITKK